jgi:hypothetical protein
MKGFKGIIFTALALMTLTAFALPAVPASAVSSAALSIVPKKNYTVEPGKSVKDTLTIRNLDSERSLSLNLRVVDFTFTDDGGTPKLMLDEDAPQTTWSLKPFLSIPKSVNVEPNGTKTVDMSVAIPNGHGAGSYYSAIVYSSGAADGGNVGLSASGVTLVFTSIPGDVKEDLQLTKFGAYRLTERKYSYINTTTPDAIAYTLKNNGNVTEAPVGTITLKHMFGKEQDINNVNPNQSLALIGQERTFTACIKLKSEEVNFNGGRTRSTACATPGLWPGYYSLNLDLFYGQNGNRTQEIVENGGFWYLPWWFIGVSIVVIAVAAYYIAKTYRAIQNKLYGTKPKRKSRRR